MENYRVIKVIGDGTYGVVSKAIRKNSGDIVAIKRMKKKFITWDECMQLREIKSLKKLLHPNIVRLREVIRVVDMLHLVFEHAESNLYLITKDMSDPLPEAQIQSIIHQTLLGISFMHRNGFFHRDVKPENLLVNTFIEGGNTTYKVKICDFGQAREIRSLPPYTEYIATRWYRAPECLLRSNNYNSPIDMFAVGCIMAELYLKRPLFPGTSENDQLFKICSVLGTPTQTSWAEGLRLGAKAGYQFPNFAPTPLSALIPGASKEAIDLISAMLRFDPLKRITASAALSHPFFAGIKEKEPIMIEKKHTPEFSAVMPQDYSDIDLMLSPISKKKEGIPITVKPESVASFMERKNSPLNSSHSNTEEDKQSLTKYSLNSSFESVARESKGFHKPDSSSKNARSQSRFPDLPSDLDDISAIISDPFWKEIEHNEEDYKTSTNEKEAKEEKKNRKFIKRRKDRERPGIEKEEAKASSSLIKPELSGLYNDSIETLENKNTRPEPIKSRTEMIQKPFPSMISKPSPNIDSPAPLSGESNLMFYKKHLGASVSPNSGTTGSGLRAAARDTYKTGIQLGIIDSNPFVIPRHTPGDPSVMAGKSLLEENLLYKPSENIYGDSPVDFHLDKPDTYKQSYPPVQPSGNKYQFSYGRYKYQH